MAKSKSGFNKLDDPLKNVSALNEQISWEEYDYKNKFEYVCEIKANANEERLEFVDQVEENMNRSCVYAMVINGKIFKIGAALRGIKGRIGSYNSGRTKYRTKGTNSGTNYWVLQSLIKMNVNINIYAHFPPTEKVEILGEEIEEPFPSAKSVEGVILKHFETQYGKKPIGCTQG